MKTVVFVLAAIAMIIAIILLTIPLIDMLREGLERRIREEVEGMKKRVLNRINVDLDKRIVEIRTEQEELKKKIILIADNVDSDLSGIRREQEEMRECIVLDKLNRSIVHPKE